MPVNRLSGLSASPDMQRGLVVNHFRIILQTLEPQGVRDLPWSSGAGYVLHFLGVQRRPHACQMKQAQVRPGPEQVRRIRFGPIGLDVRAAELRASMA